MQLTVRSTGNSEPAELRFCHVMFTMLLCHVMLAQMLRPFMVRLRAAVRDPSNPTCGCVACCLNPSPVVLSPVVNMLSRCRGFVTPLAQVGRCCGAA